MAILGKFFPKKAGAAGKVKTKEKNQKTKTEKAEKESVGAEQPGLKADKKFVPGVILSPRITEKSSMGGKFNKYIFDVYSNKNKIEIKNAVEKMYGVKVQSVRVMNMPSKKRRVGRVEGRVPGFKKAVVSVADGQTIELQ
jgi:large subunit ribosomal protein L23